VVECQSGEPRKTDDGMTVVPFSVKRVETVAAELMA
jgi:hypothetical protein